MAQSRFTTVRDLFEAFPTAQYHVQTKPTDQPPIEFIQSLVAAGHQRDAISCCAFLLPRREAVWWACQCVRAVRRPAPDDERLLRVAEAWVRDPEEQHRQEALRAGAEGDTEAPALWACRAAAWSGGVVDSTVKGPIHAAPDATARAARAAVLIAMTAVGIREQEPTMTRFVDNALQLAQRGVGA